MNRSASAERQATSAGAAPIDLNLALAAGHVLVNLYVLFVLPLWLLPSDGRWGWSLLPLALLSNPFWSIIHESIHDLFHPAQRTNQVFGRAMGIFFGAPFRVLRVSHLLHHKLNRTPLEGTDLYDPEKSSRLRASLGYYSYILGGLYFLEVFSPALFFLPKARLARLQQRRFGAETLAGIWMKTLATPEAVREIRVDGAAIAALYALSFFCYGGAWPLLLGFILARAVLISFLDNVYHYRTPVNDIFYAANLELPAFASRALLYFNLHGIHHRNPALPWIRLPQAFAGESARFAGGYVAAAWRQLYGPVPTASLTKKPARAG